MTLSLACGEERVPKQDLYVAVFKAHEAMGKSMEFTWGYLTGAATVAARDMLRHTGRRVCFSQP